MTAENKSLREQIEKEIEEAKSKHGEFWQARFFNNFYAKLPGGNERIEVLRILDAGEPDILKHDEESYVLTMSEKAKMEPKMNEYYSKYSSLRFSQSQRDFHKTIDNVFEELGINPKPMIEAQKKEIFGEKDYMNILRNFEKDIIEVYIKLREKGYFHYPDLRV